MLERKGMGIHAALALNVHRGAGPVLCDAWTGFPELFLKIGPGAAFNFPGAAGFVDRKDRKDRFCREKRALKNAIPDRCSCR